MINTATKNILLVDDHPIFLDALGEIIVDRFPYAEITKLGSASEAREHIREGMMPTLAVVDVNLPDASGIELIRELHTSYRIPIIAFSGQTDDNTISACIRNGAIGYIPKSYDTQRLYAAIDAVILGGQHFPSSFQRDSEGREQISLTRRQRDVLELVMKARPNREIAGELDITVGTVKNHVSDLLTIFGAASRNELLIRAQQMRVLQ
jgi:DNA-binding NarL/FixJ family response regulator